MALSNPALKINALRPVLARSATNYKHGVPAPPIAATLLQDQSKSIDAVLELADGTVFRGISFGADGKSVAGECVFQTGAPYPCPPRSIMLMFSWITQVWLDTRNPSRIRLTKARSSF